MNGACHSIAILALLFLTFLPLGAAETPDLVSISTNTSSTQSKSETSRTVSTSPGDSSSPTPTPVKKTSESELKEREISEIHGRIALPVDWTLIPGKLLEGDVLLATREKITGESDPWTTGLSMTIDRNGAKDSGQKAGDYALGLAKEAAEKAGEEASPVKETRNGEFREFRFDFPVASDPPLRITEVLRANDSTGTLAVILWQSPRDEAPKLEELRDRILSGLILDPTR